MIGKDKQERGEHKDILLFSKHADVLHRLVVSILCKSYWNLAETDPLHPRNGSLDFGAFSFTDGKSSNDFPRPGPGGKECQTFTD